MNKFETTCSERIKYKPAYFKKNQVELLKMKNYNNRNSDLKDGF